MFASQVGVGEEVVEALPAQTVPEFKAHLTILYLELKLLHVSVFLLREPTSREALWLLGGVLERGQVSRILLRVIRVLGRRRLHSGVPQVGLNERCLTRPLLANDADSQLHVSSALEHLFEYEPLGHVTRLIQRIDSTCRLALVHFV